MSILLSNKKTDKEGYNDYYRNKASHLLKKCDNPDDFIRIFERSFLSPYCNGGYTKGYVRGLAVQKLVEASRVTGIPRNEITVLDAGCGLGELSVYLACKGFNVKGVDISIEACQSATEFSKQIGVSKNISFLAESLEDLSIADSSIDFVVGHAALHHFIKYDVPKEFHRVMKDGAKGFFADSFGENPLYHIFHDKEEMERLGDVILSKELIYSYFHCFKVELIPTDWFVMLDKLYQKVLPMKFESYARSLSKVHFWLDRRVPRSNRISLYLSGAVMTTITKIP
jgi:2-polyprenyl-3-methyl-5-hydroxy-6-metoxy-1,4-benzoquinol methylase